MESSPLFKSFRGSFPDSRSSHLIWKRIRHPNNAHTSTAVHEIASDNFSCYNNNGSRTGKPRPSLTWWRDYTILDDSFEFNDKDGELAVRRVLREE